MQPEALPLKLLLLGFLVAFVGVVLMMASVVLSPEFHPAEASIGGIVLIGFIPIMFGYGPWAWLLVLVAAVVMLVLIFVWAKWLKLW